MALGNEIDALREIEKEIDNIRGKLKGSHEDILAVSKAARDAQGSFMNIRLPKELEKSLKANQTFLDQLNAQLKERDRLESALQTAVAKRAQAESRVNKELLKNREETRLLNKAMKDEAILSSTLVGEYRKLEVRHSRAAKTVRDLSAANKENTNEYRRAVSELQRYRAQLDKADRATGNFRRNVGNYKSALQSFTAAYRQFAGVFGVGVGLQIAREIFENVKAIDALDQALKAVTKTQAAYNESQNFLLDVSERYGIELRSLTENYTKYLASLQGTTLEGDKGVKIFEALNRVSAKLNLSQEKQNGLMNAFVQIISKGTVQAEELRGQLGDRLPGAFNIMARAIGVSTEKLNKMLKDGEVIADEVLPKFADEMEKTFGTANLQRIDSLVAAQNRLSNEWTIFLTSLTQGDGLLKNVFTNTLYFITSVLGAINEISDKIKETFETEAVKAARQEYENFAKVTQDQVNSLNTYVNQVERLGAAFDQLGALQANVAKRLQDDPAFTPDLADETAEALIRLIDETSTYNDFIKQSADIVDRNDLLSKSYLATLFARVKGINQVIDTTSDQIDKETELYKTLKDVAGASELAKQKLEELSTITFGTTVDEAKKLAKEAKDIADSLSGTLLGGFDSGLTAEDRGFLALFSGFKQDLKDLPEEVQTRFKEIQEKLKNAREEFRRNTTNEVGLGIEALGVPNPDEVSDALLEIVKRHSDAQDEIVRKTKLSTEEQKALFNDLFSTFSNYYGIDLSLFNDLIDKKKFAEMDLASTLKSITNAVFESKMIAYENEIAANQERLDIILADENATEEQKSQAKLEAERKEKEIRLKQAKAERNNVLIQIGIDTAAAVAKTLALLGPFAAPVIPGIIALGVAQAAFVAAQPLPKFQDGVRNFEGGKAMINDQKGSKFRELVETPDGKFFMSNKRNVVADLPKGSNVYNADETQAILNGHHLSESERIDLAVMRMSFNMFGDLENKIENGIDKGFKKARITNNIKNVINQPTTKFF